MILSAIYKKTQTLEVWVLNFLRNNYLEVKLHVVGFIYFVNIITFYQQDKY
jgi:hypothetical protein